jgi:tungstate transport system ATP-binding protein
MIALQDVLVQYEERIILDIPELHFAEGKRYGLIGENGSGKTTLLRLLAGTLSPTRGQVTRMAADGMGYMPQNPYAFSFSVLRNVEMALDGEVDREAAARAALRRVGMDAMAQASGSKLSGGEAQRMAFARMIAKPRRLLLLDEPTSSTDIKGTELSEATLSSYLQANARTLIFSTHSPAQALRLAEDVIFLDQGRIVEQGPAECVLETPQNERTQLFLEHWRI